jgi:hypothetical protein
VLRARRRLNSNHAKDVFSSREIWVRELRTHRDGDGGILSHLVRSLVADNGKRWRTEATGGDYLQMAGRQGVS